jgi:hypothetical protein
VGEQGRMIEASGSDARGRSLCVAERGRKADSSCTVRMCRGGRRDDGVSVMGGASGGPGCVWIPTRRAAGGVKPLYISKEA